MRLHDMMGQWKHRRLQWLCVYLQIWTGAFGWRRTQSLFCLFGQVLQHYTPLYWETPAETETWSQNSVSFSGTPQLYCSTVDVWWGGFVRHQLFFVPSGLHPLVSQERNKETVQLIDVWRVFLILAQEKKPETSHDHIRVGFTWNKTLCIPGLEKCHLISFWINVIFNILCTGLQQETGFNSMVWKLKIIAPCTVALSAFSELIRYWSLEIKRTKTDIWDRYWQQNWKSLCQKLQYNWLKYCS